MNLIRRSVSDTLRPVMTNTLHFFPLAQRLEPQNDSQSLRHYFSKHCSFPEVFVSVVRSHMRICCTSSNLRGSQAEQCALSRDSCRRTQQATGPPSGGIRPKHSERTQRTRSSATQGFTKNLNPHRWNSDRSRYSYFK